MRNIGLLVLLTALAAVTWLAGRTPAPPSLPAPTGEELPLGYYLRGARLVGTDEQGRVAYRILAQRLDELPDQERLDMAGVAIEYEPTDETPWRIVAAGASAPKDGSQLDLRGSVELLSSPTDGSEPVRIATEQLSFSPESSIVATSEAVTIRVGDWQLAAIGLRTYLKGDTLELESNVHGKFAP